MYLQPIFVYMCVYMVTFYYKLSWPYDGINYPSQYYELLYAGLFSTTNILAYKMKKDRVTVVQITRHGSIS